LTTTYQIKVSKYIDPTPNPLPVRFPGGTKDSSQCRLIGMQLQEAQRPQQLGWSEESMEI